LNELEDNANSILIDLNSLDNVKNQIIEILNNNDYISLFQTYLSTIGINSDSIQTNSIDFNSSLLNSFSIDIVKLTTINGWILINKKFSSEFMKFLQINFTECYMSNGIFHINAFLI